MDKRTVIVFSGGTDSTCAAALAAEHFNEIHLLTFYEYGTKSEPFPIENVKKLREHFPKVKFIHKAISTDNLVKFFSYKSYLKCFFKFKLLNVATPAFSSLSWHTRTIAYCLEKNIKTVSDGMTNEMVHLPGHMKSVLDELSRLYSDYGIEYSNPVRSWEVPQDQQFLDRLIVDQHGFFFPSEASDQKQKRTTGQYLYELGLFPHPNIKGSEYDKQMQHDCYQFVMYNMMAFWIFMNFSTYEKLSSKVAMMLRFKIDTIRPFLNSLNKGIAANSACSYFEKEESLA